MPHDNSRWPEPRCRRSGSLDSWIGATLVGGWKADWSRWCSYRFISTIVARQLKTSDSIDSRRALAARIATARSASSRPSSAANANVTSASSTPHGTRVNDVMQCCMTRDSCAVRSDARRHRLELDHNCGKEPAKPKAAPKPKAAAPRAASTTTTTTAMARESAAAEQRRQLEEARRQQHSQFTQRQPQQEEDGICSIL